MKLQQMFCVARIYLCIYLCLVVFCVLRVRCAAMGLKEEKL